MFWITPLLILAAPPPAAEGRYPDAVEIYHCEFTAAHDTNYDNWPDDWRRQRDPQHPTYVEIGIVDDASATGQRCVRVELDGGAAAVFSPPHFSQSAIQFRTGWFAEDRQTRTRRRFFLAVIL